MPPLLRPDLLLATSVSLPPSDRTVFGSERRDAYRLELRPGQATLRVSDGHQATVQDLSASGGSFLLAADQPLRTGALNVELDLGNGERFSTALQVVHARAEGAGLVQLGARFEELDGGALTKLSRFITDEHVRREANPARLMKERGSLRVDNPLFIANLFTAPAPARERRLLVVDGDVRLPVHLLIEGTEFVSGSRRIRARSCGVPWPFAPHRLYTFVLTGAGAVTIFQSTCEQGHDGQVLLSVPEEVRQSGFRQSPRVGLQPHFEASVAVAHPRVPGLRLAGRLTDVAGRGLSFEVDAANHSLFPGDRLSGLRVLLPDGTVDAVGIVRSVAARQEPSSVCGIELTEFSGTKAAEQWHRFVFQNSHPNLTDLNGRAEVAWKVLEDSKYIDLWTPRAHRQYVRANFVRSWQTAAVAMGNTLGLRQDGQAVGVSAGSLAYPGTFILHHLGIVPSQPANDAQTVMRQASDLITGLLYRLRDVASMEHFVIYAERGKRWNERLYSEFARRYADPERLQCSSLAVHRRLLDDGDPVLAPLDGLRIVAATAGHWTMLADQLSRDLPGIECRAYALGPTTIDLQAFGAVCSAAGHERGRSALVAELHGQPVACLIAERGNEGANVFGLLNSCRIVRMGAAPVSAEIRRHLLAAAVTHYRAIGKKSFLFYEAATDGNPTASLSYEAVSPALRMLAHKDVIPAWTAYLRGLLNSFRSGTTETERSSSGTAPDVLAALAATG